jgi:hypothetical protein
MNINEVCLTIKGLTKENKYLLTADGTLGRLFTFLSITMGEKDEACQDCQEEG